MTKIFFITVLLSSSSILVAQTEALKPFILKVDGRERIYYLHIPEDLPYDAPLVFVLHGYGGNAKDMIPFTKMNSIAEKNGFAVCYPEAVLGADDAKSWNVGYSNYDIDDLKYLSTLAQNLQKEYKLSPKNTFSTGMSNGGDMSIQLAIKRPDIFSAVASVVGCLMNWLYEESSNSPPISVFMTNGTKDGITFWNGEVDYPAKPINGYLSTPQMLKYWLDKNQCSTPSESKSVDINKSDGSHVKVEKWKNCDSKKQVWMYSVINGAHDWPGSSGNMDLMISEEIWSFFSQFIK